MYCRSVSSFAKGIVVVFCIQRMSLAPSNGIPTVALADRQASGVGVVVYDLISFEKLIVVTSLLKPESPLRLLA